ncbi:Putative cytosolic protein (plasmid) [Borrelia miyamotoi FR64b]|uniref:Putative cytosolic protein n=1 Tax=Borrelia miyamotoi FR64b TaxID=1292392 RepID=W5SFK9_9SPIR|nr:Putative cytosolic protein [Borrelia miyamotoi FR64b]
MNNLYDMKDIYFSIGGKQISSGKLELTSEPTSRAVISSEDRGMPVVSFRDPKTITFIFHLEVTLGSQDYILLTQLASDQFYNMNVTKNDKILDLVFNDQIKTKIISNVAVFSEEPARSYSAESEKVTFEIKAINCEVITKPN